MIALISSLCDEFEEFLFGYHSSNFFLSNHREVQRKIGGNGYDVAAGNHADKTFIAVYDGNNS